MSRSAGVGTSTRSAVCRRTRASPRTSRATRSAASSRAATDGSPARMRSTPAGVPLGSWRFVTITALFVTTLVISNVIAVKLVGIGGRVFPAGLVIFPLSYLLGDVLTEVYGYAAARAVIWLGFACNLLAVGAIQAAIHLPAAGFYRPSEPAYDQTLGTTWRLFLASLAAYVVGEFANSFVLAKLKLATQGRFLWTRTIGSTVVGEG